MERNNNNNNNAGDNPTDFWQELITLLANLAEEIAVEYYEPQLQPYNPNVDGGSYYDFSDRVAELKDLLGSDIDGLREEIRDKLGNLLRLALRHVLEIIVSYSGKAEIPDFNSPAHKIFEYLISALLGGNVVGQSNDKGIDVMRKNDKDQLDLIAQCKAGPSYKAQVAHIFRELLGTCWIHRCSRAILAMTAENVPSQDNILTIGNNNNANYQLDVEIWDRARIFTEIDSVAGNFLDILDVWWNLLNILRTIPQLQPLVKRVALALRKMADVIRKAYEVAADYNAEVLSRIAESRRQFDDDDTMKPWEKAFMRAVDGSSSEEDEGFQYDENDFNVYSDEEIEDEYESEDETLIEEFEKFNFD